MTNYIVDTSVLVQRVVREAHTSNVLAMLKQVKTPDELCVPEFCILECINVLWKQVIFNATVQADAEQLTTDLLKLSLRLLPTQPVYMDALKIGIRYKLAVYDSIYIALAKHLNYPLITVDQKQAAAAQQEQVILKPITDFTP
jgi:predicted nucleic acid-binding protein